MGRYKLILFATILCLYCGVISMDVINPKLNTSNTNTPVILQPNVSNTGKTENKEVGNLGEHDLQQVMKMCNESFQIPISYMEEMNMTGSYPDETEKIPMCFMKCYLENVGAISSDNTIIMKQAELHFVANEDVIKSCFAEQSEIDSLDPCEYAYFLARCIMMATLVDNRKSDT